MKTLFTAAILAIAIVSTSRASSSADGAMSQLTADLESAVRLSNGGIWLQFKPAEENADATLQPIRAGSLAFLVHEGDGIRLVRYAFVPFSGDGGEGYSLVRGVYSDTRTFDEFMDADDFDIPLAETFGEVIVSDLLGFGVDLYYTDGTDEQRFESGTSKPIEVEGETMELAAVGVHLWAPRESENLVLKRMLDAPQAAERSESIQAFAVAAAKHSHHSFRFVHAARTPGTVPVPVNDPHLEAELRLKSGNYAQDLSASDFRHLRTLDLSNRPLSDLSGLNNLPALKSLNVDNTRLLSVPAPATINVISAAGNSLDDSAIELLGSLPNLTQLNISHNKIQSLAPLSNSTALRWLSADGNGLQTLQGFPEDLTFLSAQRNPIPSLANAPPFESLVGLNLRGSVLSELAEDMATRFPSLVYLDAKENHLADIPSLESHPALFYVDVSVNNLDLSDGGAASLVVAGLEDDGAVVLTDPQRANLPSFETWRAARFSAAELEDSSISGALADADGDGLANLGEYALRTETYAGSGERPSAVTLDVEEHGPGSFITLRHRRLRFPADIAYSYEYSDDGRNWLSAREHVEEANVARIDAETEEVVIRDTRPVEISERRFLRVRISGIGGQ